MSGDPASSSSSYMEIVINRNVRICECLLVCHAYVCLALSFRYFQNSLHSPPNLPPLCSLFRRGSCNCSQGRTKLGASPSRTSATRYPEGFFRRLMNLTLFPGIELHKSSDRGRSRVRCACVPPGTFVSRLRGNRLPTFWFSCRGGRMMERIE